MGTIKHNTIVVTGWDEKNIKKVRSKAVKIFEKCFSGEGMTKPYGSRIISEIIEGLCNSQYSFFIAPDGSKEGWETSDNGDKARKEFCDWLDEQNCCEYIEIRFGGDTDHKTIVRSNDTD